MQANILTDEQYRILSRKLINTLEAKCRIIPVNTLKSAKYVLKKPIYITLEKEKDIVIASLDDIEAFAYADTEFEAINLLCEEIIHLYEDLIDDRKNLGNLPKKWLHYLEEVLDKK